MAYHEYRNVKRKEKSWTFEELKADHEKLCKDVKHLKKELSEYYDENKKLSKEIHDFKNVKKDFKFEKENLEDEIKYLKKLLAQYTKK